MKFLSMFIGGLVVFAAASAAGLPTWLRWVCGIGAQYLIWLATEKKADRPHGWIQHVGMLAVAAGLAAAGWYLGPYIVVCLLSGGRC